MNICTYMYIDISFIFLSHLCYLNRNMFIYVIALTYLIAAIDIIFLVLQIAFPHIDIFLEQL